MARDPLPILLCTYWHETIFSNRAVIELYQQLTQPKRLVVQIGDHGTGESTGLAGLGSRPTNAMVMWFNHHLKGEGELDGHEVVVETMHHVFGEAKKYPSWQEFVRSPRRYHLGPPEDREGSMAAGPMPFAPWEFSFDAGEATVAETAEMLVQTGAAERLCLPQRYDTSKIDLSHAGVWRSPAHPQRQRISGEVQLHLTVRPEANTATLVAYLFDVPDAFDLRRRARIITSAAYTIRNSQPGQETTIDLHFQLTDYDLTARNRLQLVIDSKDKFLADESVPGTKIYLLHDTDHPAYVDIPVDLYSE